MRWLVSGEQDQLDTLGDARSLSAADDIAIFEGVDEASTVKVPKVEVAAATAGNSSYYAYWVEDQGVKVDLAWNEGSYNDADRQQAARLSASPGPDHAVFDGPFSSGVTYPLEKGSGYVDKLQKAFSPSDMPLVLGNTTDHATWLETNRHDMAMNVRGVMADVKKGGLRRDLSLAFEMDGAAESENATIFNQQTTEFVGNGDLNSSPYLMPGTSLYARHLFRDYGPDSGAGTPSAGNFFSDDITQPLTTVRGPSWWLLRDYANLYKRLKTSGTGHALSTRPYFPNRTYDSNGVEIIEDLVDIHADNQWMNWKYGPIKSNVNNWETNSARNYYCYRPMRANYAPVLLGVNAIYSLVYSGNQLKMVVDPFFIVWNPYNTKITADKFAVTLEHGFAGGVRFRVTDANGVQTLHGIPSGWGNGAGSDTYFVDYAKNKSGENGHLSYLINNLSMEPGEVMIYSPPNEGSRSSNANVLHDELLPGINYNATDSGIFFDKFPNEKRPDTRWWVTNPQVWDTIPGTDGAAPEPVIDGNSQIQIVFNIASQAGSAIVNIIETNVPPVSSDPEDLTSEESYGNNVSAQEYRLNLGGGQYSVNLDVGQRGYSVSYNFSELGATKKSFGILSMLTMPTDYIEADTKMEAFSHLNATPMLRTQWERFARAPLNIVVKTVNSNGINNLMNQVGIDIDAFGSGDNGFYGKSYSLAEGDTKFPLIDIPKAPLHSLVQLSGANIGTGLFEPTHAIGNSWKPPYTPQDSIYHNSGAWVLNWYQVTKNDVSWQVNDALFDGYYFSGIAPAFTIGSSGYVPAVADTNDAIEDTLQRFYGINPSDNSQTVDPETAHANPALEPHVPSNKTPEEVVADLNPNDAQYNTTTNIYDGYKKVGAYSLVKGAFNVNSTSVKAWAAFLQGNKTLALESIQGTNDTGTGTPFPLANTTSNTSSNNGWEKFSRLTDAQIWNDSGTPNDFTDDTGLSVEIVNQVKARGPFMSLSDFVNRRIGVSTDLRSYHGAIQEAIEQAGINGNQTTGIRAGTSDVIPNYANYSDLFPFASGAYIGSRNNATGIPMEINQANILLPLAPRLSARSDTFKIRGYGEVRDSDDNIIAQATCEAIVQRLPEYVDPDTNEPWDDDSETPTLNAINQTYGRKFEIQSFRWLDQSEV